MVKFGTCGTCGMEHLRIQKDGMVWRHGDPTPGVWPPRKCPGAGDHPKPGSVHEASTEERKALARQIRCPKCHSQPHFACKRYKGIHPVSLKTPHRERIDAAIAEFGGPGSEEG